MCLCPTYAKCVCVCVGGGWWGMDWRRGKKGSGLRMCWCCDSPHQPITSSGSNPQSSQQRVLHKRTHMQARTHARLQAYSFLVCHPQTQPIREENDRAISFMCATTRACTHEPVRLSFKYACGYSFYATCKGISWLFLRLIPACVRMCKKGNTWMSTSKSVSVVCLSDRALQCKYFSLILKANEIVCMCAKAITISRSSKLLPSTSDITKSESYPEPIYNTLSCCFFSFYLTTVILFASFLLYLYSPAVGSHLSWKELHSTVWVWTGLHFKAGWGLGCVSVRQSAGALDLQVVWCFPQQQDRLIYLMFSMRAGVHRLSEQHLPFSLPMDLWFV